MSNTAQLSDYEKRGESPHAATRTGRWIRLAPLTPSDHDFLYALTTDEEVGFRWRFGGSVPARPAFEQMIWTSVLTQFIVIGRADNTPIGHIHAYNADLPSGIAYVGQIMTPHAQGTGVGAEAFDVFATYLFRVYPLRKIYLEVPEYNLSTIVGAGSGILKEEGRLIDHSHYDGRTWDRIILALHRSDFESLKRTATGRIQPSS